MVGFAPRHRKLVALAGGFSVALAAGACDVVGQPTNVVNGKQLFVQKCAACHSLDRAGSQATIGPDLDAAFDRAIADGLRRSTVEGIVEGQILHPRRGSRMPAKLVTGQDAKDVAAYVAQAAAAPGQDTGALAEVGTGKAGGPPGRRVFTGAAGCGTCHVLNDAGTAGTAGPNLDRSLANRSPAFIRESIVEPDAAIEEGYQPGVMPSDYRSRLAKRELDALVSYLADVTRP